MRFLCCIFRTPWTQGMRGDFNLSKRTPPLRLHPLAPPLAQRCRHLVLYSKEPRRLKSFQWGCLDDRCTETTPLHFPLLRAGLILSWGTCDSASRWDKLQAPDTLAYFWTHRNSRETGWPLSFPGFIRKHAVYGVRFEVCSGRTQGEG